MADGLFISLLALPIIFIINRLTVLKQGGNTAFRAFVFSLILLTAGGWALVYLAGMLNWRLYTPTNALFGLLPKSAWFDYLFMFVYLFALLLYCEIGYQRAGESPHLKIKALKSGGLFLLMGVVLLVGKGLTFAFAGSFLIGGTVLADNLLKTSILNRNRFWLPVGAGTGFLMVSVALLTFSKTISFDTTPLVGLSPMGLPLETLLLTGGGSLFAAWFYGVVRQKLTAAAN